MERFIQKKASPLRGDASTNKKTLKKPALPAVAFYWKFPIQNNLSIYIYGRFLLSVLIFITFQRF